MQKAQPNTGTIEAKEINIKATLMHGVGATITGTEEVNIVVEKELHLEPGVSETVISSNCNHSKRIDFLPSSIKATKGNVRLNVAALFGSGVNFHADGTLEISFEKICELLLQLTYYQLPENKKKSFGGLSTKISGGIAPSMLANHLHGGKGIIITSPTGRAHLQNTSLTGGKVVYNMNDLSRLVIETLNPRPQLYSYRKINFAGQAAIAAISFWSAYTLAPLLTPLKVNAMTLAAVRGALQGAISAGLSEGNILKSALQSGTMSAFGEFTQNALSAHKYKGLLFRAGAQAAAAKVVYGGNFAHGAMGNLITAMSGIYAGQVNITTIKEALNNAITTGIIAVLHNRKLKDVLQAEVLSLIGGRAAALGDALGNRLKAQAADRKLTLTAKAKLDEVAVKTKTATPTRAPRAVTSKTFSPKLPKKELTAAFSPSMKEVYSFDRTKDYFDYFLDSQTPNYGVQESGRMFQESAGLQQRSTIMLFWQYATNQLSPQAAREVRQAIGLGLMEGVRLGRDNIISLLTLSDSAHAAQPTPETETFMFNTSFQYCPNLPKVDLTANISKCLNREFGYLFRPNNTQNLNSNLKYSTDFRNKLTILLGYDVVAAAAKADVSLSQYFSNDSKYSNTVMQLSALEKERNVINTNSPRLHKIEQDMFDSIRTLGDMPNAFERSIIGICRGGQNLIETINKPIIWVMEKLDLEPQGTYGRYLENIQMEEDYYRQTYVGQSLEANVPEAAVTASGHISTSIVAGSGVARLGGRLFSVVTKANNISKIGQASALLPQALSMQPGPAANFALNAITFQQAMAIGGGTIGSKLVHDAAINAREAFPYLSPEPMLFSKNILEFRSVNKEQILTTVFPIVQLHLTGLPFPVVTLEPHILPYPIIDNKIISYSGPAPEVKRPLIFSGNPHQYQEDKKVIGPDYMEMDKNNGKGKGGKNQDKDKAKVRINYQDKDLKYHKALESLPGFPEAKLAKKKSNRKRWKLPNGKILEWDSEKKEIEMYNKHGIHIGAYDPYDGRKIGKAVPGRRIDK